MLRTIVTLLLFSGLTASALAAPGEPWCRDLDSARATAKRDGKDLLVAFTGSGWCPWSERLEHEVLRRDAFLAAARERFVLVSLDEPAAHERWRSRYGIDEFPTVLLLTPDGAVYARTGYRTGGPTSYLHHLLHLRATLRPGLTRVLAVEEAFDDASDEDRSDVVEAAVRLLDRHGDAPYAARLLRPVKAALRVDPENESGLKGLALGALVDADLVDDEIADAIVETDPGNDAGLLERLVAVLVERTDLRSKVSVRATLDEIDRLLATGRTRDPETSALIRAYATLWSLRILDDGERARRYAESLGELEPRQPEMRSLLDAAYAAR